MVLDGQSSNRLDYLKIYLIEETVEEYHESRLSRRDMLRRVLLITGSIPVAATALMAAGCTPAQTPATTPQPASGPPGSPPAGPAGASPSPGPARAVAPSPSPARAASPSPSPSPARDAVTVSPNDPAIETRSVEFPGQGGPIMGYLSQPRAAARAPGIIVIHENRGLNEHIKDMTRRYAKDGYVALAVDLLSREGGTDRFADPGQIPAVLQTNLPERVQDLVSGAEYLTNLPNVTGPRVGVVGYCFGGGMAWQLAIHSPDIGAAVPYYGPVPQPIDEVQNITAPVLGIYGENDQRINQGIQPAIEAMTKYDKTFEVKIYPGAGHAFNNDTGPNYNAAAARDAYQESLNWFARYLQG